MAAHPRPLSPHLTVWRWGPGMAVSILHRITGNALTVAGLALLTWWLYAIARGGEAYEQFAAAATHPLGLLVLIGLTWAFWQHFFSGLRHLFMDMGAGLDLKTNRFFAILTIAGALFATALTWFMLMGVNR